MDAIPTVRSPRGGTPGAAKSAGVMTVGAALVILGAWSAQAAELTTPKKSTPPAVSKPAPPAAKSSPTLQAPEVRKAPESAPSASPPSQKGAKPTAPTTSTREPAPGSGSKGLPCGKGSSTLKTPGSSPPCPDSEESGSESDDESASDPDSEPESAGSDFEGFDEDQEFEDENGDGYADDRGYTEESAEDAEAPADYEDLTGKIPGLDPFSGEDSGASEGATLEGGRPWYENLGKPGGGRPPASQDDEE